MCILFFMIRIKNIFRIHRHLLLIEKIKFGINLVYFFYKDSESAIKKWAIHSGFQSCPQNHLQGMGFGSFVLLNIFLKIIKKNCFSVFWFIPVISSLIFAFNECSAFDLWVYRRCFRYLQKFTGVKSGFLSRYLIELLEASGFVLMEQRIPIVAIKFF